MKSFVVASIIAAAATAVNAQYTINSTSGVITCDLPNAAYCAAVNIIIRCNADAIGEAGNCNDNLAGEPPIGDIFSPCYETSDTAGDAACSKNCIIYEGSGGDSAENGTSTVPGCTPTYTASTSTSSTTSSVSTSASGSTTTSARHTKSKTTVVSTSSCTSTSSQPTVTISTTTASQSFSSNGTTTTTGGKSESVSVSATATPSQPTTTLSTSPTFTGAAMVNTAGGGAFAALAFIAAIGLL